MKKIREKRKKEIRSLIISLKLFFVFLCILLMSGCIRSCMNDNEHIQFYEPCIYIMNADGSDLKILIKDKWVYNIQFIPNTTKILYTWNSYLYIINYNNNEINIINDTLQVGSTRVSANGEKILFYRGNNGYGDLYICNIDGTNVQQLTNSPQTIENYQSFSYDAEKIVYVAKTEDKTKNYTICTLNINKNEVDTLITSVNCMLTHPIFSPDGEKIYYIHEYNTYYHFSRLYGINKDGTNIQEFDDDYVSWNSPLYITTNGDKILYKSDSLHIVNSDHTGNLALVKCNGYSLSSDGTEIAYSKYSISYSSIYKINSDGSENKLLFFNLAHSYPVFSPSEDKIVFTGYYQINETKINYLTN